MADTELYDLTLPEAGALVRGRKLSPVEYTQALLARTDSLEPQLNAYITRTSDAALEAARAAEAEIAVVLPLGHSSVIRLVGDHHEQDIGAHVTARARRRLHHLLVGWSKGCWRVDARSEREVEVAEPGAKLHAARTLARGHS